MNDREIIQKTTDFSFSLSVLFPEIERETDREWINALISLALTIFRANSK